MSTEPNAAKFIDRITPEAIHCSALIADRLRRICSVLRSGPLNTRQLAETLGIDRDKIRDPVLFGVATKLLVVRPQYRGGAGGRLPDVVALNVEQLLHLPKRLQPIALTAQKREWIERLDWRKARFKSAQAWWNVARLISQIGKRRQCLRAELCRELEMSESNLSLTIRNGRRAGFLSVDIKYGYTGRLPAVLSVDWNAISRAEKFDRRKVEILGPQRRPGVRPLMPRVFNAGTDGASLMVETAEWQRLGIATAHRALNVRALCLIIGAERRAGHRELAAELGCSVHTIECVARDARNAGVIVTSKSYDLGTVGPRTTWRVVNREWAIAATHDAGGMLAGKSTSRPIRKDSREAICAWVKKYRDEKPEATLDGARQAYREAHAHADVPSLAQLKAAMHRRYGKRQAK